MHEHRRVPDIDHRWELVRFDTDFHTPFVVLASMQTARGPDTSDCRVKDVKPDRFKVSIEEDQAEASGHTQEIVGYVAANADDDDWIRNADSDIIGKAFLRSTNQVPPEMWRRVEIPRRLGSDVVVFGQVMSHRGTQPVHVRLADVGRDTLERDTSFFYKMEEWESTDQQHEEEMIGFIALKRGVHALHGGDFVEVGHIHNVQLPPDDPDDRPSVLFDVLFDEAPTVLVQCQTYNGPHAVSVRQDVTQEAPWKTLVALQESEVKGGWHVREVVGYAAFGSGDLFI